VSRIDEALRKAALAAEETGESVATTASPELPDDIEQLSREEFPIEIMERRRTTRVAPIAAAATASASTPVVNGAPPTQLLERVETRIPGKTVTDHEIAPESIEQYRRLAATLHHAQIARGLKVVMVTSALVGEGKTLTASNLALTLSESYKRHVLLIDADLRRPSVNAVFKINETIGLTEGLMATDNPRLPVQQVSSMLGVLSAGRPTSDPIAGLTSERMRRLLDEARDTFDWVIVDTPPIALLTDANLLAAMVDGAVLVVKAGSTPYDLAQRAVERIGRERILGVVLNRTETPQHSGTYGYYGYYGYYAPKPAEPTK
jgi:capsular exopolysaccharide synthesis family protein